MDVLQSVTFSVLRNINYLKMALVMPKCVKEASKIIPIGIIFFIPDEKAIV